MSNRFTIDQLTTTNKAAIRNKIPPPSLDLNAAGVHPDFANAWESAVSEDNALVECDDEEEFDVPNQEAPPPTFAHAQDALGVFDSVDSDLFERDNFNPVWAQSLWLNTMTALAACLSFRKPNTNQRTSPTEQSGFPDYTIPYPILIDYVRSMEVILVQHFQHNPSDDDISKFLSEYDHEDGYNTTADAVYDFSRFYSCFWKPPKLTKDSSAQTDLTKPDHSFLSPISEEKEDTQSFLRLVQDTGTQTDFYVSRLDLEVPTQTKSTSLQHTSTQTDPIDFGSMREEKEAIIQMDTSPQMDSLSMSFPEKTPPLVTFSPKITPPKRNPPSKPTVPPKFFPTTHRRNNRTSSPKPMSLSGDSSLFSPRRVSAKPHLVLSRVQNAETMDYHDVRRAWDSALDGFSPPSPELFYSSNIHRFRRFGLTGLGILFKQAPTNKQLKRFVTSCSRQQGRCAFDRVFRSVSNGGVKLSLYDEAHRSPPRPTQLSFESTGNQPRWSPSQISYSPHEPQQHSFSFAPRFLSRRSASRFPTPTFRNTFPLQPPPQQQLPHQPQQFQTQLTQLQQQINQMMQAQQQLFQQIQQLQYFGFS